MFQLILIIIGIGLALYFLKPKSIIYKISHVILHSKLHHFDKTDKKGLYFCNVCSKLMLGLFGSSSYECTVCGIITHKGCRAAADDIKCKLQIQETNVPHHQWLVGNLPINSVCCHCGLICGYFYDLEGRSCLWCQRVVHDECRIHLNQICDFGEFKDIIISPTPQQSSNKPIIVVINQKSGGQSGKEFFKSFNRFLNPCQVIDISQLHQLEQFKKYKNAKLIVAGGDGTVASVINYMKDLNWNPPIAILPLGTGNDLSRALGWGGTYQTLDGQHMLQQVSENENITMLDRWKIQVNQKKTSKSYIMFNYFGIGLDAKFCYDFHNLRTQSPELFKSRIGNKFIYTQMGLNDLFKLQKIGLGKKIILLVDGIQIEIPDQVENIIVLNIKFWSGGVTDLWKSDDQFKMQRMNDGLLEVIGVTSILHLGRIQVGVDEPYQIAQGRKVQLIYKEDAHIQIDGEPFKVGGCEIVIEFMDKVQMLQNVDQENEHISQIPNWEAKFIKTMEWAQEQDILNSEQKKLLIERMLH